MKKVFAWSLAALMTFSLALSGCGKQGGSTETPSGNQPASEAPNGGSNDGEKVKIRMMYWNKQDTMQAFLDKAKEKLPNIEIEFQFVPVDQLDGILNAQLQAGEGPDILPTGQSETMVKAGYLLDLSDQDFLKNYEEAAIKSISVDGKTYGVPGLSWYEGMFYNKEIFDKYGLKPPTSWEELMALHKTLKEKGVKPQAMGAQSFEPMMKSTLGLALADWLGVTEDGKKFDASIRDGSGKFAGSKLAGIVEKWSQYIKEGYITPDMLQVTYDDALKEFATGEAAMWESGPWAVEAIQQTNPNLKFDMFPFYGDKKGEGWLIGGPGVTFGVNAASKHQKEALEVLAYMSTPEAQQALWDGNKGAGSFVKGFSPELPEYFQGVAETLKAGRTYCPWFVWSANNGPYIETYGKGLQEYLQGNTNIEEVLKAVDEVAAEDHALKK